MSLDVKKLMTRLDWTGLDRPDLQTSLVFRTPFERLLACYAPGIAGVCSSHT